MEVRLITPVTLMLLIASLFIMFFLMKKLFKNSVLFKIGISSATVIILASFISGVQVKLGPVHNAWSFPLQVVLAIIAYTYISRNIKKPLENIIKILISVSNGNLHVKIDDDLLNKKDEIGEIARAMKKLQGGLSDKASFAKRIGEGNFNETFVCLSDEDELGNDMISMQLSLQTAKKQEAIRKEEDARSNWITEGQARFAEILRGNTSDLGELSYKIISNMVKYLGINQGGIFILNDNESQQNQFLELTACYAYDRRKFVEKRIEIGEGLVGTCFQEGQTIYLKEIPDNYMQITSGLGTKNPTDLLIVPLKINEDILGVMELASFGVFEKHHIDFAEKIGEIIASSISGVRINNRTVLLLEKSQQQGEEMKAQEEEMRQNLEELHATQEAMAQKDRENLDTIRLLRQENEVLQLKLRQKKGE